MENINVIDLIKKIEEEFFSRIDKNTNWGKNQIRIEWDKSVIKVYSEELKSKNNSIIDINNTKYRKIEGKLEQGDKYIVIAGDKYSHVKTFHSVDLECIKDCNSGLAVKVKEY